MKHLLALLLLAACAVSAQGQTIKTLGYNTTNSTVIGPTSGVLLFTNGAHFLTVSASTVEVTSQLFVGDTATLVFDGEGADDWRSALGLGATWLTNTNVTNFRTAIGLGATNDVTLKSVRVDSIFPSGISTNAVIDVDDLFLSYTGAINGVALDWGGASLQAGLPINFITNTHAAATRTNLNLGATWLTNTNAADFRTAIGLGETNQATFQEVYADTIVATTAINNSGNFTNNGDININSTTASNGLLYIRRSNNESFLGLANLIASNNVTVSNETLFRVGVSEATNKAAQFGFRSTNTNGNGVAVFSVFGYNALMMIGPTDPAAGTNPIQATVYSVAPTNKVMTLITTNTGAMLMHRPIGIDTAGVSTNAPANTTNVAGWIQFYVGTNSVRVPYYQ
jgi:hypothetical protein